MQRLNERASIAFGDGSMIDQDHTAVGDTGFGPFFQHWQYRPQVACRERSALTMRFEQDSRVGGAGICAAFPGMHAGDVDPWLDSTKVCGILLGEVFIQQ